MLLKQQRESDPVKVYAPNGIEGFFYLCEYYYINLINRPLLFFNERIV